jgi:serine acetyltransferase
VSGNVLIGQGALIGAASAVRENLKVGNNATVGLGATVVKDVADNITVVGTAAIPILKK